MDFELDITTDIPPQRRRPLNRFSHQRTTEFALYREEETKFSSHRMATPAAFDQITCSPGRTSPEFSGADRDGGGWSPTPDRDSIWDSATNDSKPCSKPGASLSPPLTSKAEELGARDNPMHHLPSRSPSAPVKGAPTISRHGSESKLPALACPFYRFDPRSHYDCRSFTLRRVKDIKQHIQRKHTILPDSEFYCELCLRVFDAEEHHDNHDATAHTHQHDPHHTPCPLQHGPSRPLRVITGEQKEKLKSYLGRGKPIHEQWYDMWDILFPGQRRPRTIHLDSINNSREGRMKMLRRVWETHRVEILTVAFTPPLNIPTAIPLPGLGESHPWSGSPRSCWQQSRAITATTARSEIFAQWSPFDQVMDAFLDLVKEEMTDDVADVQVSDTDGPDPDGTVVEAACSLLGAQQPWCPSVNSVYCPEDLDSILWADPRIEFPGMDMTTQGGLALAPGNVTYNFPTGLSGSSW